MASKIVKTYLPQPHLTSIWQVASVDFKSCLPVFGVVAVVVCSLDKGEVTTGVIWEGTTVSSEGQIEQL